MDNLLELNNNVIEIESAITNASTKSFIEANTTSVELEEMTDNHIIPVFIKDNEPVISHCDFIKIAEEIALDNFSQEQILRPVIRVSHPIKGRIPEAKQKPANLLKDHEKTLYYERMAFVIEIPSIHQTIGGCELSLCIGGVKAYNLDNLYNKKGADEHFKIFIGFQNKVCTNMCVWSDGYYGSVAIKSLGQLKGIFTTMVQNYNFGLQLHSLMELEDYYLTEKQFAHLIGKCRMYNHLPLGLRNKIPQMLFGDTQIGVVCKDYYKDDSFCRDDQGNINLWRLYNLLTGANKSSYIDNFLDRSVNAYSFVEGVKLALQDKEPNWFLQ